MKRDIIFDIRIRMATVREVEAYPEIPVSVDESAVVYVGGELVAFTDEYGTAYLVGETANHPQAEKVKEQIEAMMVLTGDMVHERAA